MGSSKRLMGSIVGGLMAVGQVAAAEYSDQARFFEEQLKISEGYSQPSVEWRYGARSSVLLCEGASAELACHGSI
jgi:hypothetical protein